LKKKLLSELENYIGGYVFSDIDVDLYAIERYTRLPVHTVEDTDDPGLISVTIANKKIFWPADLPVGDLGWLYHEIFDDFVVNPSSYDWPQLDYANRNWFIDAGAAEGYFSIFALEKSPQALIVCLEPLRLLRKSLERTLGMYENETRAIVVSSALGASPGQATFQVDYDHISDSGILPSGAGAPLDLENRTMETVDVTTLDQLAEKYSLGSGGLIKMDIEGFEMAALGGAAKVLKNYKPALAIAVYHEHDNARKCAEIILAANPSYNVIFRGCYGYFDPPRPYMLFAV
jgi:FkbM family methyltransferase